jgi:tetratricopeptide (TPR) repeat protein
LRWGDACLDRGDAEGAAREYARALELLKGGTGDGLVAAYVRLGRANQLLGRVAACVHFFKKALDLDPREESALRALIELHSQWEEWEAVANLRARLRESLPVESDPLEAVSEPVDDMAALRQAVVAARSDEERARAWLDLGNAAWFELEDRVEAVRAFQAAFIYDRSLHEAVEMLALALVATRDLVRLQSLTAALADASDANSVAALNTLRAALRQLVTAQRRGQR